MRMGPKAVISTLGAGVGLCQGEEKLVRAEQGFGAVD